MAIYVAMQVKWECTVCRIQEQAKITLCHRLAPRTVPAMPRHEQHQLMNSLPIICVPTTTTSPSPRPRLLSRCRGYRLQTLHPCMSAFAFAITDTYARLPAVSSVHAALGYQWKGIDSVSVCMLLHGVCLLVWPVAVR